MGDKEKGQRSIILKRITISMTREDVLAHKNNFVASLFWEFLRLQLYNLSFYFYFKK